MLVVLAFVVPLLLATPVFAATATDRPLLFSFDGSDTTAGALEHVRAMAVDQVSGSVYVTDEAKDVVDKFNANGQAATFSATGTSSLDGSATPQGTLDLGEANDIAVDSSSVNPGRIYISSESGIFNGVERTGGRVNAYGPDGEYLWQLAPGTVHPCGVAVDAEGHLWIADSATEDVREFANTGSPPAELASFTPAESPCKLDLDTAGDVYVKVGSGGIQKYFAGTLVSTFDPANSTDVAVDQSNSSGHIFTLHSDNFNEYEAAGALAGTYGANAVFESQGIGYNPALDRVYIAPFSGKIEAFGPIVTGTVPDPVIEAPTVGVSKATFQGKINPQNVPNSYYFEWKTGTDASWAQAKTSSPQTLPEDNLQHPVSFEATGLSSNTTYQVRLVAENSESHLHAWSSAETFSTAEAPDAPAVTIDEPAAITISTAAISGTVNPREDFGTTWRLETSTDLACASGFSVWPLHKLESEASAPVTVSEELTGLLAHQHYCVRIRATNSFGTATSEVKEFTTETAAPSQVFTAFAAPRTDTTARLNGRVDPEGAPLTYRFEYSKDGGATWIALPEGEDTSEVQGQIVVGEELGGLTPDTEYSYRFSAENEAGEPIQQGAVETFKTRSSAEMAPPTRGIELVNRPDKGNQAVDATSIPARGTTVMTQDGEKVLWSVHGGAPEGNVGTGATYLARRTSTGWVSASLVPSAAQQIGGGGFKYALLATTPDFSKLLFRAAGSTVIGFPNNPTVVRLDDSQHQETLRAFEGESRMEEVEMTDDGSHVLVVTPSDEIEDIGGAIPVTVSILPEGAPAECLRHEFLKDDQWQPNYHMMASTDASRVYFHARPNGSCGSGRYGLYERDREVEETTLIDPGAFGQDPELIRATPNGRSAYFLTYSRLDPADSNSDADVYRWNEESGEATCVTCVVVDANVVGEVAAQQGRVMVSDDFSHIYFESEAQLIAGLGETGHRNLYALSDGQLGFVADVGAGTSVLKANPRLSIDGNVLLFRAPASRALTADGVAASCVDPVTEEVGPCLELYRYDDRDHSLECVSCRRTGSTMQSEGSEVGLPQDDYKLSADGRALAFLTPETLVRADVNNDLDVYEWRDGAVRLVTDGVSDQAAPTGFSRPEVLAVDHDGSNLLFALVPPGGGLTGFEQDGQMNLYDARIGGGFEPPSPAVHCVEDSCQGPLQAPPGETPTSSSSFSGHGNLAPQRKKRGRCAAKRGNARRRCSARSKRHRRHSHRAEAHRNTGRAK